MNLLFLAAAVLAALSGAASAQQPQTRAPGSAVVTWSQNSDGSYSSMGGCAPYHLSGATTASTNANLIVGRRAVLCHLVAINTTATLGYMKVYDLAAAPACSTSGNLKHVYPVPASTAGNGFVIPLSAGETYQNGIAYCVTASGTHTANDAGPAGIYIEGSYK